MNILEFKKKFTKISDKEIGTGQFSNTVNQCCVIGHAMRMTSENPEDYSQENCSDNINFGSDALDGCNLRVVSRQALVKSKETFLFDISGINNRQSAKYNQETSKKRVIAFLDYLIYKGYGKENIR
jgi:hypothetical protein